MFRPKPVVRDLSVHSAEVLVRPPSAVEPGPIALTCCVNVRRGATVVSCGRRGSPDVVDALREGLRDRGMADVEIHESDCLGPCNMGPNIRVAPSSSWIFGARVQDVPRILDTLEKIAAAQAAKDAAKDATNDAANAVRSPAPGRGAKPGKSSGNKKPGRMSGKTPGAAARTPSRKKSPRR